MQSETFKAKLNEQQLQMLALFKTPMPEEDYLQLRRLAVQLLAKRLDTSVETWEQENNVTAETYETLLTQHFRSTKKND